MERYKLPAKGHKYIHMSRLRIHGPGLQIHADTACRVPLPLSPISTTIHHHKNPTAPYHVVMWYIPSTRTRVPSFLGTDLLVLTKG